MKSLLAFIKKETMEQFRSGRLMILGILFVLLGVMNPAVAKITPWLLEILADSLAESGMTVTPVTVSAMDSWVQFFKNMPLGLIVFVLLQSSIFTKEYQSGTLVLSLTKGLERFKVVVSKTVVLTVLWTVGYLPTLLANGNSLIYGVAEAKTYIVAILITVVASLICFAVSIPIFNKKQL